MENTTHTPGPWIVRKYEHNPGMYHLAIETRNQTICNISPYNMSGDYDARLIAAAPELLAALQFAEGYLIADVHAEERKGDKQDHLYGAKMMLDKISAAIAKATGVEAGA